MKILTIARKEVTAFFKSPVAYIVLFIILSVFNTFFFLIIDENREADLRDMFKLMEFLFVFIVPLLTMRIFAQEKSTGTMEFLMTSPVTNTAIVLGKYLGCLCFFSLIVLLTGVYYLIFEVYASPDGLAMVAGYGGIWLEGAFFIALGVLISSLTSSQIVGAIVSYLVIFTLYFGLAFLKYASGLSELIIRQISVMTHSENFFIGIITSNDIIYFLSGIALCLIFTRVSIDRKLWH